MMLIRFLIAGVLLLAACQSTTPQETSTSMLATLTPPSTLAPPTQAANDTSGTPQPQWLETEMNGVTLGIWKPDGWETDLSEGLVLAEHTTSARGYVEGGMLIYVFVPPLDEFKASTSDTNFAWTVLNQVVKMPSHTGYDVAVSDPARFEWDEHNAAYYLLSSGDGIRAVVLALAIPGESRVVVCNVSVPANQAQRIRTMLPQILNGLTVNGQPLDGASLTALPDPLPFPRYSLASSQSEGDESSVTVAGSP